MLIKQLVVSYMKEKALFNEILISLLTDLCKAKKEIKIAVAWFTNHELYDALLKKLKDGIKVTLIIINDPINNHEGGLDWQGFINCGGVLHFSYYPHIMHHKFCIIDNKILYNGSYNWTYYAERINRENIIRFYNTKLLIEDFLSEFNELTQKHKRYKRVKRHSLDDLISYQRDRTFNSYISKELEANGRYLIKSKKYDIASKVYETAVSLGSDKVKSKLEPIIKRINNLNKQLISNVIVTSVINKELQIVKKRKLDFINSNKLSEEKKQNINRNSKIIQPTYYNHRLSELKKQETLLQSLKKDNYKGDFGELRFNLKWSTYDDLDLHIIDPSKNHIYYSNKIGLSQGSKGQLDIDANGPGNRSSSPQENIFWESRPPIGKFKIYVDHFEVKQKTEVPFVLSVISTKGKSKIIFSKIHFSNFKTMLVAEIMYGRKDGVYSIMEKKIKAEIK